MDKKVKEEQALRTNRRFLVNKRSILALLAVLALMALLATQAVWAQEEDDPCSKDGDVVTCTYAENDTDPVVRIFATSPERDEVKFFVEGLDAADFTVDGGVLRFKKSPNYEMSTDRARIDDPVTNDVDETEATDNNVYLVTVRSTDVRPAGATGAAPTSTVDVIVTVTNLDEPGTATISLRQPEVGTELTGTATDPDGATGTIAYEWSVPKVSRPTLTNDSHWQDPSGTPSNIAIFTPVVLDESKYLRLKATYRDGEGGEKAAYVRSEFRVREDVETGNNNPPAFDGTGADTRKIPENADVGDAVGNPVVATDPNKVDAGRLTYSIVVQDDSASFSIHKATGQIRVALALDYELGSVSTSGQAAADANNAVEGSAQEEDGIYVITVMVTDPSGDGEAGSNDTKVVVITATDVDEVPSVKGQNEETEPDATHMVEENSNLINETDLESADNNPYLYLAVATDDDDTVSLLLNGDDAAAFKLVDMDGTDEETVHGLTFKEAPNYEKPTDANKDNAYKVKVVARDDKGHRSETDVTVVVTNVNEPGKVTLSSIQPAVGTPLTATVTDPDGEVTNVIWQWTSGPTEATADGEDIDDATSATYTPTAGDAAEEDDTGDIGNFLRATAHYNDPQGPDDKDTASTIENQRDVMVISKNAVRELPETNAAPVFTERSVAREVAENTATDGAVGDAVKAADGDEDVLTYSLSGGADKGAFKIDQESGQIKVGDDTKLDFEGTKATYTVEVKAEDPFALSDVVVVIITVTDVDEAPVLGLVPGNTAPKFAAATYTREVAENTVAGMPIGDPVTATDNEGNALTYSMSGDDAASLTIGRTSGQIRTKAALDYETEPNTYTVTVRAADPAGLSDTATVTITVTDVDEDPVVSGNAAIDYAENGAGMVATYTAADPENGGIAWSLSGDDADDFEISGAGMLTFMSPPDFESPTDANADNMYSVMVVASDGINDGAMGVTVTVTDVDENVAPEFAGDTTTREVEENTPQGENIGGPVAAMTGDDDTLTYAMGGADASSFIIIRTTGQIKVRDALDYERKNSYTVTVTATDESDLSDTITVTIMVTDKVGLENAYDVNDDGVIDKSEALNAVDDYFAPGSTLTKAEVLEVIALYLGS